MQWIIANPIDFRNTSHPDTIIVIKQKVCKFYIQLLGQWSMIKVATSMPIYVKNIGDFLSYIYLSWLHITIVLLILYEKILQNIQSGLFKLQYSRQEIQLLDKFQCIKYLVLQFKKDMSYSYSTPHHQTLRQFVPTYVLKSDYLPTAVHQGQNPTTAELLRRYEQEKRRGRVFTQRPVEFNPNRYVSYCTYENVAVDKVLDHDHFSRVVRR